jgi:hypothetical protein
LPPRATPNAATVERRGDLPKRLGPGRLGVANGRRDAIVERVGPASWFALAIVWVAVWPQWWESGQSSGRQIGDDKPTPDKRLR